jgi:hypothetical protein
LSGSAEPAACMVSSSDLQWLDRSLAAVLEAAGDLGNNINLGATEIIVFDADCMLTLVPTGERRFATHDGTVPLPMGNSPAVITSFAAPSADAQTAYFVMALPSIWEAAGFSSEITLYDFTLGVFAHEISHVWQLPTFYQALRQVDGIENLPAPVNDDMVQRIFADDPGFRSGVEAEIRTFANAAHQQDAAIVRAMVVQAQEQMQARWQSSFTGELAALADVDAIFLTLEGSGQWFALQVLTASPSGPRLERDLAMRAFGQRGGRWSQDLGLAMVMVLERLLPEWRQRVYGGDSASVLALLDAALFIDPL